MNNFFIIKSNKMLYLVVQLASHTLSFGGVGESGMGAYHGKFSSDAFYHKKQLCRRCNYKVSPYTKEKLRLLMLLWVVTFVIICALFGRS